MKVIGCDLFLDLDIFKVPEYFINELKEKYIVKEGVLRSFVNSVMDNIVNKERQKNKKALSKAHDAKLEQLEKKAAAAIDDFTNYLEDNISDETKAIVAKINKR